MPGNRRQSRRQGVVYGPPRQPGKQSENGVLIGRFLGLGILLLTLGVLAAGALAFVNDQPAPQVTPLRTIASAASFTFVARTPTPTTAPTAAASLVATPPRTPTLPASSPATQPPIVPTPPPPLVQIGRGHVTFGTQIDELLHIQDPRSTFTVGERIIWSAHLTRRANSIDLRTQILKADPIVEGGLRLINEEAVAPLVQNARLFSRRVRPELLEGAGVYTVRYLRGDVVLSEGSFMVTQ